MLQALELISLFSRVGNGTKELKRRREGMAPVLSNTPDQQNIARGFFVGGKSNDQQAGAGVARSGG